MNSLLKNEKVLLGLGLVLALAAIMYFNPPHTPCTSQKKLYDEGIAPLVKTFNKGFKDCRDRGGPGGCLTSLEVIDKIDFRLNELGKQCQAELIDDSKTRSLLLTSMELFVKSAWGSKPPANLRAKLGWLQAAQVEQFCKLRKHLQSIYGEKTWLEFVERMIKDLPGAASLDRDTVWNMSVLSEPCRFTL